ncbi:hypothetical protein ACH61_02835 [Rathayibacter tanaceti]|uniref:Uncharacterized protein n=1 Tax=Rathayibacter tanaceti TaxID=1671680 RepID=A0A162GEX2_9MICO|nr:hypothetical protein ACH61_02835 [Rathayibacter tanaceti]
MTASGTPAGASAAAARGSDRRSIAQARAVRVDVQM